MDVSFSLLFRLGELDPSMCPIIQSKVFTRRHGMEAVHHEHEKERGETTESRVIIIPDLHMHTG